MTVVGILRVKVSEARGIKAGTLEKSDPYTQIKFGKKTLKTKTIENAGGNCVWNETFTLELEEGDLTDNIEFKVYDEDVGRDDYLGELEMSIKPWTRTQGKAISKWYKLTDKKGEIKIDAQFAPFGKLNLTFVAAKHLKGSTIGKNDPYCTGEFNGKKFKTPTHENGGKTPEWNHTEEFEVNELDDAARMDVRIMDADIGKDDKLAVLQINVAEFCNAAPTDKWVKVAEGKGKVHLVGKYTRGAMPAGGGGCLCF